MGPCREVASCSFLPTATDINWASDSCLSVTTPDGPGPRWLRVTGGSKWPAGESSCHGQCALQRPGNDLVSGSNGEGPGSGDLPGPVSGRLPGTVTDTASRTVLSLLFLSICHNSRRARAALAPSHRRVNLKMARRRVKLPRSYLLVHYQYGMKRVIRIRDRWGPQPWQSLPLAVQGQGLYWRNPHTEAPSSIQDTASLRFSFGGQQLLVLACSCSLVSLPSMRTPAPPSCR